MHVRLIDYAYGGLEAEEMSVVEEMMAADQQARDLFDAIQQFFAPLEADRPHIDAPHGLAQRTCRQIWDRVDR